MPARIPQIKLPGYVRNVALDNTLEQFVILDHLSAEPGTHTREHAHTHARMHTYPAAQLVNNEHCRCPSHYVDRGT